jgi:hypothetical protein
LDTPAVADLPARPDINVKRELLRGLADALTMLAKRLQTQETTKRMIFLLAARAETIAAQAWDLNSKKNREVEQAAGDLVAQFHTFATSLTDMSNRVADDIAVGQSLAAAMVSHATRLLTIARALDAAGGTTNIMAQLRPLAGSLTTLASRQQSDTLVAKDTAALAERATQLAERAQSMATPAGARGAARTGIGLHYALRAIADDAAAVSLRMATEAALLKAAVAEMAIGTQKLATADSPKIRTTQDEIAADRIRQVVRKGQAAGDWVTPGPARERR